MQYPARNATYLGVRDFFKKLARQTHRPAGHYCTAHQPAASCFSTIPSTRPSAARGSSEHELPVEVYFSEGSPLTPSPRFDWRLRAPSRSKRTLARQADKKRHAEYKGYAKRLMPPHTLARPGDAYFEEIRAYNKWFLPLLEAEQAEGEAVLRERLATWSLSRLCEEGYCLTGLSAFWMDAPQFGRPVACFLQGPGIVFQEHRFQNGTQVLVSRLDPLAEVPYRGSVMSTTPSQIRIAFEEKFDVDDGFWRIDVGLSNIVFERMRTAIARLNQDLTVQEGSASDSQYILHGTHLRDVLLRSFSPGSRSLHEPLQAPDDVEYVPRDTLEHQSREGRDHGGAFKDDMRIQSWVQRYARRDPIRIDGDPHLHGLNPTQTRAVAMMLGERISLVQGPPGTGKTKTIIEAVHFEVHHPLLVCTYTNAAVDNLVEGFGAVGLKPLRVGFGAKVKSSLNEYGLDYQLGKHPLKPRVDKLLEEQKAAEKRYAQLNRKIEVLQKEGKASVSQRLERMRSALALVERQTMSINSKLYAMHQEMLRDITTAADVSFSWTRPRCQPNQHH
ncbi:hypothetical protein ID866_10681 [Astraeus odoratus]|nr:hypothetical protein ID866_10681 [Astraeus odoratus]